MTTKLTIPARNSTISLQKITDHIDGAKLSWKVLHIEAAGNLTGKLSMLELEKKIEASARGISFSWDGLRDLAKQLDYSVELLIGGGETNRDNYQKSQIDDDLHDYFDLSIELFDSSYWVIQSHDTRLISEIAGSLNQSNIEYQKK